MQCYYWLQKTNICSGYISSDNFFVKEVVGDDYTSYELVPVGNEMINDIDEKTRISQELNQRSLI